MYLGAQSKVAKYLKMEKTTWQLFNEIRMVTEKSSMYSSTFGKTYQLIFVLKVNNKYFCFRLLSKFYYP